jgi:hypothetical protein
MTCSDEDHGRSRRADAEDRRWSSTCQIHGGRTVERSGDAVCDLHRAQENEERGFLDLVSKLRATMCQWFDIKTTWSGFLVWASKPAATV